MNKFTIIFLILFFLTAILVGVLAVRERFSTAPRGEKKCPISKLPSPGSCPQGQTPKLTKDERGCYLFVCQ